jgi:hypothetical protein
MSLYRKKPVVIEAFEWKPTSPAVDAPSWFFEACASGVAFPEFDGSVTIKTLEGNHRGEIGDFIIQGIKGELYPCKPDIFVATYEAVEP